MKTKMKKYQDGGVKVSPSGNYKTKDGETKRTIKGIIKGAPSVAKTQKRRQGLEEADKEMGNTIKRDFTKKGPSKYYGDYKTGGMINPNAKLQAGKKAGSKGVTPGVNPKAAASKVAKGRSGGTSAAPKTATPKAKYGMTMKKYGEGGGTKSGSSMYNIKQGPAKTPTGSTSTMNPVEKAKAKYGMTVKRKK